nr:hypothetical protein [Candidatus Dadabacteria bacterium]
YFFEDWSKIQQVLGDNLKADDDTKFILSKFANNDIESLLGEEMAGILGEKVFTQNSTALSNPQSYIGIYEND